MAHEDVPGDLLEGVVRPETKVVVLLFGARVDPPALVARERTLLVVRRHEVLSERRPEGLKPVAKAADDREIRDDGVRALEAVARSDEPEERTSGGD